MARLSERLPQNAEGEFFVDSTCIDCDRCRQLAPGVFGDEGQGTSFVQRQPAGGDETHRALMALVACPTASIGTVSKLDASAAVAAFPDELPFASPRPEVKVYDCGFASEDSYGATSYLIVRPGGNVLVDSPRAVAPLSKRIEALGGVRWLFLTHRDDVADHGKLRERFGCDRVLHRDDLSPGTRDVERLIEGEEALVLDRGLTIIPVPGHTRGSAALLLEDHVLFSGDHLWANDRGDGLSASRSVCWYSWPEQQRSIAKLAAFSFRHVLPGHGRVFSAPSTGAMREALRRVF